jgi:hypothetical protein
MEDSAKVTGAFTLELYGSDGVLKERRKVKNVITTAGKTYMAAWLAAASQAGYFMRYIALGTGTDAADASDTALQTELTTRVAGTLSSSTNVWSSVAVFPAGTNTGAITEGGVFSASTVGTMLSRQTFAVINKGASDSLTVTWNITLS